MGTLVLRRTRPLIPKLIVAEAHAPTRRSRSLRNLRQQVHAICSQPFAILHNFVLRPVVSTYFPSEVNWIILRST